ncbi:MAG: hypothetical protein L0Z55_01145 [Planctomycetes bacterium]|nr:hypothetical protein [Planctomycetota bacterium]
MMAPWATGARLALALGVLCIVQRGGAPLPSAIAAGSTNESGQIPAQRAVDSPTWILPFENACGKAARESRPVLIVSLNGNLDGYC